MTFVAFQIILTRIFHKTIFSHQSIFKNFQQYFIKPKNQNPEHEFVTNRLKVLHYE